MPQAAIQGVVFPHGTQVAHQMKGALITDIQRRGIRHRERKARALKQRAKIADLSHRSDARRQTAGHLDFGLSKGRAQFEQGLPAKGQDNAQAVRAQGATALDELAHRIIAPMQTQAVDHQILSRLLQIEDIGIRDDLRLRKAILPHRWKRRDDRGVRKCPVNHRKPILRVVAGGVMQKQGIASGAGAMQRQGVPVCKARRIGHMVAHRLWSAGMQTLVQVLYPPRCLSCGGLVETDFGLCGTCWRDTPFVSGLACDLCGVPLPGQSDRAEICDDCVTIARPWAHGRAALVYRDRARRLVLGLKHGDRHDIARPAARWMARVSRDLRRDNMVVVPVPLHLHRHLKRRYNQAALLAEGLARELTCDWCPDALQRLQATPALEGKSRAERFETLCGRISIADGRDTLIAGRAVLIVDDVMTTGATLAAATEACLSAGATEVCVTVLARAAKDT